MNRGKKCIALSPKIVGEREMIEELIRVSDVIIDPYRPGVLEKLGIGPEFIYRHNKQAVLLRVTGYGQTGPMSKKPGHDLNYISVSGIVPLINGHQQTTDQLYQFPTNFLADFVSCSLGITATLSALAISRKTGLGRIVDCSMAKGANYYSQIVK
jgi:alpha-methylacyl-CoA racemase